MYDGAGTLFALGFRTTQLDEAGNPVQGTETCYVTDSLVTISTGLDYTKPSVVTQTNGAGITCVSYAAPASLTGAHIASFQLCVPDPIAFKFLLGGDLLMNQQDVEVGWAAPEIGSVPNPNGLSLELFTRAVTDGSFAAVDPYFWWVFPRCMSFQLSADSKFEAASSALPEFTADAQQNPNWGAGPDGNWQWRSDRVWQYARVAEIPDLTRGYRPVAAPPTPTGITITPAVVSVPIDGETTLEADAAFTDGTSRDVTGQADWTSSAPGTVVVGANGLAQGVTAGTATITAQYGGASGTSQVVTTAT
jgi:hypothetical protein